MFLDMGQCQRSLAREELLSLESWIPGGLLPRIFDS